MKTPKSVTNFGRLAFGAFPLATLLIAAITSGASAQIIYKQPFTTNGTQTTFSALGIDWAGVNTNTGADNSSINPVGIYGNLGYGGGSTIGAATGNGTSTYGGVLYVQTAWASNAAGQSFYSTTNLNLDPTVDNFTFSWNQLFLYNSNDTQYAGNTNLLLQVGGVWYVSATQFNIATTGTCSVAYNPTASKWIQLSTGATPSSSGAVDNGGGLLISTVPSSNLSGNITGFGLLVLTPDGVGGSSVIGSGNWWSGVGDMVDNFEISQTTIAPEPTTVALSAIGGIALLNMIRRRRA